MEKLKLPSQLFTHIHNYTRTQTRMQTFEPNAWIHPQALTSLQINTQSFRRKNHHNIHLQIFRQKKCQVQNTIWSNYLPLAKLTYHVPSELRVGLLPLYGHLAGDRIIRPTQGLVLSLYIKSRHSVLCRQASALGRLHFLGTAFNWPGL